MKIEKQNNEEYLIFCDGEKIGTIIKKYSSYLINVFGVSLGPYKDLDLSEDLIRRLIQNNLKSCKENPFIDSSEHGASIYYNNRRLLFVTIDNCVNLDIQAPESIRNKILDKLKKYYLYKPISGNLLLQIHTYVFQELIDFINKEDFDLGEGIPLLG